MNRDIFGCKKDKIGLGLRIFGGEEEICKFGIKAGKGVSFGEASMGGIVLLEGRVSVMVVGKG